jgi:hypothetical protein
LRLRRAALLRSAGLRGSVARWGLGLARGALLILEIPIPARTHERMLDTGDVSDAGISHTGLARAREKPGGQLDKPTFSLSASRVMPVSTFQSAAGGSAAAGSSRAWAIESKGTRSMER